jgi:hypothetical protein
MFYSPFECNGGSPSNEQLTRHRDRLGQLLRSVTY